MSRIKYELFGNEAEVCEFESDSSFILLIVFKHPYEGLISIEGVVSRVNFGHCRFDSRLIDQGEHTPVLILTDRTVRLPKIVKAYGKISPASCTDEYTRSLSIRERRLCQRVEALERKLEAMESQISRNII